MDLSKLGEKGAKMLVDYVKRRGQDLVYVRSSALLLGCLDGSKKGVENLNSLLIGGSLKRIEESLHSYNILKCMVGLGLCIDNAVLPAFETLRGGLYAARSIGDIVDWELRTLRGNVSAGRLSHFTTFLRGYRVGCIPTSSLLNESSSLSQKSVIEGFAKGQAQEILDWAMVAISLKRTVGGLVDAQLRKVVEDLDKYSNLKIRSVYNGGELRRIVDGVATFENSCVEILCNRPATNKKFYSLVVTRLRGSESDLSLGVSGARGGSSLLKELKPRSFTPEDYKVRLGSRVAKRMQALGCSEERSERIAAAAQNEFDKINAVYKEEGPIDNILPLNPASALVKLAKMRITTASSESLLGPPLANPVCSTPRARGVLNPLGLDLSKIDPRGSELRLRSKRLLELKNSLKSIKNSPKRNTLVIGLKNQNSAFHKRF